MLRKIRITLAALFIIGITLLFVGIGHQWWGWMAKLQFLPSCLGLNVAVIVGILLLTFVFGRIYCSVICPLGVFQDLVLWIRRTLGQWMNKTQARRLKRLKESGSTAKPKVKNHLKRFDYIKEQKWVRYPVLAVVIVCIIAGLQPIVALIAPYSAYGRMVHTFFGGSVVTPLLITAAVTLVVIFACAWIWGRGYCNTICPVGTTLSLVSRFSLFRPRIETSKCVKCGKCYHNCKASCIDGVNHTIDYSRCVDCFDCFDQCNEGALKYRFVGLKGAKLGPVEKKDSAAASYKPEDSGRRSFIATGAALIGTGIAAKAQNMKVDGGFAEVIDKQIPPRSERLVPFGAQSVKQFYDRCTACQLCISNCPNDVLRPSTDLEHLLQPVMGYEKGYCRPECTVCSQVCPAGAILPVTKEQKQTIRIGTAHVNFDSCLAATGETGCGNCSRHCPVGAIQMVHNDALGYNVPVVMEEQCIGCGTCEFLCPVRPISAITVDGLSVHHNK